MFCNKFNGVCKYITKPVGSRLLSTTSIHCAGGNWRLKQGLDPCGNQYGPLKEIPDWSYADGRPAPLTKNEIFHRKRMREMAETIVQLSKEMRFAKENHARRQQLAADDKDALLREKLRPKQD